MRTQLNERYVKSLEKQQYRFVGNHSAVKICGWTKSHIRGNGGCYKYKFYGIRSHQCLQMTTSMYCANRCMFCWRGAKAPVSDKWYGPVDDINDIIKGSIQAQMSLLEGFKGSETANKQLINEMQNVRHVALSLIGEPVTYPKLNELLDEFHKRKISTFIVTNGQFPDDIKKLKYVTQFYLSVDAANEKTLKKVDVPLFKDYYKRLLKSLDIMKKKPFRTCIRITVIKDVNDDDLKGYKELIERGQPDFIEVKSYMHVGASRKFLKRENMPLHSYVVEISKKLNKILPDYEIISEHVPSRVTCFIRKELKKKQYLNFKKFFEMTDKKQEPIAIKYSSKKMCSNLPN
ncbi:4-demethylwyosine synthase TYW1 [Candidatus Woesearchaeota archaeon]|nr:4-demethylwyosine synthase TYW1 [Candidatus Woesearchaeota archaeon]